MKSKKERDYLATHRQIRQKLLELSKDDQYACIDVSHLSSQLQMDSRTIRSHLRVMEVDMLGIFMDPSEKQFCTKEGVSLLANTLKIGKESGN